MNAEWPLRPGRSQDAAVSIGRSYLCGGLFHQRGQASYTTMCHLAFRLVVLTTLATFVLVAESVAGETESDSAIFAKLLINYRGEDPPYNDRAAKVRLGMYINSFYSISEMTMDYSISFYLRQAWRDPRLVFEARDDGEGANANEIRAGSDGSGQIWVPDTFIRNEKRASFHGVTVPQRLLKINATGHVWYVTKISMTLSCPMNLRKFPFDTQYCPIMFESFGYTMDTLYFDWLDSPIDVDKDVQLPHFTLTDIILEDCSQNYTAGAFPCLEARFELRRDVGYYLMQVYFPSMGLIIISWLTFWFPTEAAGSRIILLLIPVLCLNHMWSTCQTVLPRVSYIKAIDVWMIGCGLSVFAVIIELALVAITTKPGDAGGKDDSDADEKGEGLLGTIKNGFTGGRNVSKIDKVSRFAFPIAFILFVIIYFIAYSI